jgi:membrane protein
MERGDRPDRDSGGLSLTGGDDRVEPIYSPAELARVERPPWWRALIAAVRASPVWPYVRDSLAWQVALRFISDWGGRDATLIAWACLVSLLPLLLAVPIVTIAVLRLVGVDITHGDQQFLTTLIPDGPLRTALVQALRAVARHAALLTVLAVFGTLWRGSVLFRQLELCLSRIAGVRPRPYLRRLTLAMVLIVLIGLVSVGTAGATVFFFANEELRDLSHPIADSMTAFGGQLVIGLVAGFGVFMFIYGVIPNHAYRVRQVWPGAVFATICFELLSLLFPLYAAVAENFGSYGTDLALIIVLVVYFYLFGVIVVVGADLNAVLWKHKPAVQSGEVGGTQGPPPGQPG